MREAPREARWRSWLREVEAAVLPPTSVSLGERCRESGFVPDLPDVYCHRCGQSVGPHEATETGCSGCRERRLPWGRLVRVGEYHGVLAQAIKEAKLAAFRRLAYDLGAMLGRRVADELERAGIDPRSAVLVPVPMSFFRRIVRGLDHTREMARGAAGVMDCPVVRLIERSHRPTQTSLSVSARAKNVAGSMHRTRGVEVPAIGPVVILDDVRTTGATLREAWRAVGKEVAPDRRWSAVVGVTRARGRRIQGLSGQDESEEA